MILNSKKPALDTGCQYDISSNRLFIHLRSGNQTWLAGKSLLNGSLYLAGRIFEEKLVDFQQTRDIGQPTSANILLEI
jgi:hypothetical protein